MYLFAFDMDGTLTYSSSWYDLVKEYGDEKISKRLKQRYYNGEISYEEWIEKLIAIFRKNNLNKEEVQRIMASYSLIEGIEDFISFLREKVKEKVYLTIISSGILERARKIARQLNFDSYHCVSFRYDKEGYVVGIETMIKPEHKRDILKNLIWKYAPKKVIAIGDSDFDIPMMKLADLKISVNNEIGEHDVDYHGKDYYEIIEFFQKEIKL